ncbi:MAG: hypothetical protein ACRDNK_22405 [Solirubrobacteraceae bacterium]
MDPEAWAADAWVLPLGAAGVGGDALLVLVAGAEEFAAGAL